MKVEQKYENKILSKEDPKLFIKLICELEECNLNHEQFALV